MINLYKQIENWKDKPYYDYLKKSTTRAYSLSKKMSENLVRKPTEPIEWLEEIFIELKEAEKGTLDIEEKSKLIEKTKGKIKNLLNYEEKRLQRTFESEF